MGVFFFGQAIQDAQTAMSAAVVAHFFDQHLMAAGFVLTICVAVLASPAIQALVAQYGWHRALPIVASTGVVGCGLFAAGAFYEHGWLILAAHAVFGIHRAGHISTRLAPMAFFPGSVGLTLLGRMFFLGAFGCIIGPEMAAQLLHISVGKPFLSMYLGLFALSVAQLAFGVSLWIHWRPALPTAAVSAESPECRTNAAAGLEASKNVGEQTRRVIVAVFAIVVGASAWGLMMPFTITFVVVGPQTAGLSTDWAVRHLIVHDILMTLPSPLTTKAIHRFGCLPVMIGGCVLYSCTFVMAYMAAAVPTGTLQLVLVWGFMILMGLGWNVMWLAATAVISEESAGFKTSNEFLVHMAVAGSLSTTFAMTHPWRDVSIVSAFILPFLLVFAAGSLAVETRRGKRSEQEPDSQGFGRVRSDSREVRDNVNSICHV
jgi:hypothetical protein